MLTAGLLFAAMLLLGGSAVLAVYAGMVHRLDSSIIRAADDLMALRARRGPAALVEAIRQREHVASDSLDVALYDRAGRLLAGRPGIVPPPEGWHDMVFPDPVEGGDPTRVLVTPTEAGGRLMIAGNRRPLLVARSVIGWLFVVASIIILLLCTLMGALLIRFLDRRLDPITRTANAVLAGDLGQRVPESGAGDEFDRAARSLNLMLDRIAGLVDNLRQVSSDLAHDLRTPLTRIRVGLERAPAPGSGGTAEAIQAAIAQIDDVVLLFEAILRIAEIDGSAGRTMTTLDLDVIARDIVETMAPAFADQAIDLVYRSGGACPIRGDRMQIAALLINLLENVLRHAPGSYRTEVGTMRGGAQVTLTVRDTGPGVPDGQLERIFDRFVRLDRSRSTAGHGLGLSMVRSVAQAHGAGVEAINDDGLRVTLRFPLAADG
ncbi:hypothetical protein GCM10011380_32650 [Sphingomonas metalli]|uniref:histidine kinase n=1 Tax=Sphingomonas metalli TaxID=1779358 RepID=A0A916TCX6_9SPHN|nr:hypothetical protein GCM10011380_32650 [Sphingomonas metalli]